MQARASTEAEGDEADSQAPPADPDVIDDLDDDEGDDWGDVEDFLAGIPMEAN